jgi:hypothetical protein
VRLAAPIAAALLAAALIMGCGDSSTGRGDSTAVRPAGKAPIGAGAKSCDTYAADAKSLRATGIPCDQARQVMYGWRRARSCSLPSGASRGSCLSRSYRCQSARTDRGLLVSCSRQGQSIAFLAKP